MNALVTLRDGDAEARVAMRGAELLGWQVDGTPLIWSPDPMVWADTAPILFPVVGWTRGGSVRVDDRSYPLGLHGFARTAVFQCVEQEAGHVRLRLAASPETLRLYPFAFTLDVTYRLTGSALRVELAIGNAGGAPMPYACGLHPGFAWPFAGGDPADYAIAFTTAEQPMVPVITVDGLFTPEKRPVPVEGRHLCLNAPLFAREALCFLHARSRSLRFAHRGGAAITIDLEGFPHLALWSRPGGRFLSIEAWTGHGDFADADGDLWRKPSMIHLAAGAVRAHAATYRYEATAGVSSVSGRSAEQIF